MTALVLTPQAATASVLLQITGAPTSRTNLCLNPSFETNTTFWAGALGTISRVVASSPSGVAYLNYTSTDGTTPGGNQVNTALHPVTAGKVYTGSASVKALVTGTLYRITLNWYTAASAFISGVTYTTTGNLSGSVFTRLAVTGVAPATATQVRLVISTVSALPSGVGSGFNIDAVLIEQVDQLLPYFDGSTPGASWTGGAHASASTLPVSADVTITRSDANGTGPVRLRTGQAPIGGLLTLTDYEPALVGLVRYDVVDGAGAITTASTTLSGLVTTPRIVGVQEPQLTVSPELVTGYDSTRESGSAVLRVLGRADPVVLQNPTRTREGRLEVWCREYDDAREVESVLADSRILLLRQPTHPGMDMYFLAQSVGVTPLRHTSEGWRWQATCRYVEVRNPNLPLLGGAGWTFDDVAAYASFAAVRASFATFNELAVGP